MRVRLPRRHFRSWWKFWVSATRSCSTICARWWSASAANWPGGRKNDVRAARDRGVFLRLRDDLLCAFGCSLRRVEESVAYGPAVLRETLRGFAICLAPGSFRRGGGDDSGGGSALVSAA